MTAGIRVSVTQPSAPASMEHTQHRVAIWSFSIFNMNSPVIFAGALTICAGALARGPTLVTGSHPSVYFSEFYAKVADIIMFY